MHVRSDQKPDLKKRLVALPVAAACVDFVDEVGVIAMKAVGVDLDEGTVDIMKSLDLLGIESTLDEVEVYFVQVSCFGEAWTREGVERVEGRQSIGDLEKEGGEPDSN